MLGKEGAEELACFTAKWAVRWDKGRQPKKRGGDDLQMTSDVATVAAIQITTSSPALCAVVALDCVAGR